MEKDSIWVVKRNLRKPRKQRGWRREQCEWEKCSPSTRATGQGLLRAHCLPCKMTGLLLLGFVVIVLNGETSMRISGSSPRAGAVAYICKPCAGELAETGGCSGLTDQPI